MGIFCRRDCENVQDCCRDVCGCCPCKYCKTVDVKIQAKETIEHKTEQRETPCGYGLIHAGVRKVDNSYTSPVLEIHTWRKAATQMSMKEVTMTQRVALGGMQTARDNADRHLGPFRGAERRTLELEEELFVIPVESILSIKYSSEVKKGETEHRHVNSKTSTERKISSCGRFHRWCHKIFCCCKHDNRKKYQEPEQILTTISNQQAERHILMTIEYIRYSNIDTPSHLHLLPNLDQIDFYKEHFHKDTLEFYLLANRDFEQDDYDLKRMQASTLCRLVVQLKAMTQQNYPDEGTLEGLISRHDHLAIGDAPKETFDRLTGPGQITRSLEIAVPVLVIQDRF